MPFFEAKLLELPLRLNLSSHAKKKRELTSIHYVNRALDQPLLIACLVYLLEAYLDAESFACCVSIKL